MSELGNDEEGRSRVLVLDDEKTQRRNLRECLKKWLSCEVAAVKNQRQADLAITRSLINSRPFNLAIIDLHLGDERGQSGAEFGRRLFDIIKAVNIVHVTAYAQKVLELPYTPDGTTIKPFNESTIVEMAKNLLQPLRVGVNGEIELSRWQATSQLRGFNSMKKFSEKTESLSPTENVTRITGLCLSDNEWANCVIYEYPDPEDDRINIALSSSIGCEGKCRFCKNWRSRTSENGAVVDFKRPLSAQEIVGQFYLAMLDQKTSEAFRPNAAKRLVVNFACEGDGLVYNLENCCNAIRMISRIKSPKISFIITSVGSEQGLKAYIERYLDLPRVWHYWSVNTLDQAYREWLMLGTRGQSLEKMRDLYQVIAEKTGEKITVSWIVIRGKTDRQKDVEDIVKFFHGRPFEVKLMALVKGSLEGAEDTREEDVDHFRSWLEQAGIPCRVRRIMGSDIHSGCGNTIVEWLRQQNGPVKSGQN